MQITEEFYKQNLFRLLTLEHQDLPIVLLEGIVPLDVFVESFPELAAGYVNREGKTCYEAKDFSLSKYLFIFKGDSPYYVAVCRFPFEEQKEFAGLARRMYVVFSENLEKTHCFLETSVIREDGGGGLLSYEVFYIKKDADGLSVYSACDRDTVDEAEMAQQCAYWSYFAEKEGVIGEKGIMRSVQ